MKAKFLPLSLVLGLSLSLVACGGEEKKEEAPKEDTTAKVEEPKEPAYEYTFEVTEVDVTPRWIVAISDSTDMSGLKPFFEKNFPALGKFCGSKKIQPEPPVAFYTNFSTEKKFYTTAAMYVNDSTLKVKAPMTLQKTYAGKALKVVYKGAYENMMKAYDDIMAYMKEKGMSPNGANWEQYITDPMTEKDTTKWQTDIYFPVLAGEAK